MPAGGGGPACYGAQMVRRSIRPATLIAAVLLPALAGCAAERARFPSLAQRPAERAYGSLRPVTPDAIAPLPPAPPAAGLVARLVQLRDQARAAHERFAARQAAAARLSLAAAGAAPGSDAWSRAQIALAALDAARSETMVAMADLDSLLVAAQQHSAGDPGADLFAIAALQAEVDGLITQEDQAIGTLRETAGG